MQRYLRRYSTVLHPSTIAGKREAIQSLIRSLANATPQIQSWNQLQRSHIDQWLEDLLYLNPSTRIIRIQCVNRFFQDLIAWQWPQATTPALIGPQDFPPRPHGLPKPLPPSLDQAFQESLASIHTLSAYGLLLLRLTGMRIGEMLDLGVNALTETTPFEFTLRVPIGKTHSERIIPVSKETVSVVHTILDQRPPKKRLAALPHPISNHLMIKSNAKPLSYSACWRMTKKVAEQISSTENIHPHRLRHTFATEMARGGMPVPALMKLLGHETPEMTMCYVEIANTDLQLAYQQAISQLKTLNRIHPAPLSPPSTTHTDLTPAPVCDLISLLVQRLESIRRDTPHPQQQEALHRLIDRIRKARKDLKRIL